MLSIVLDTNVLVAAIINPKGAPARIIEMVADGLAQPALSPSVLAEYENVLGRKKFGFSPSITEAIIINIRRLGLEVMPSEPVRACRDHADNKFLECASAAGAEYLITGNQKDFPTKFMDVKIVSPAAFLKDIGR